MQFSYTYLKQAEKNDVQLGNWNGHAVYAIHKAAIAEGDYYTFNAYVIYDDDNLLFYDGKVYGAVKPSGTVVECSPRKYPAADYKPTTTDNKKAFTEEKKTETYKDYKSETVGDVNLEIEVDNMLKSGRGTTIDELLKGFDYGLN
jgi:hypothetical protein